MTKANKQQSNMLEAIEQIQVSKLFIPQLQHRTYADKNAVVLRVVDDARKLVHVASPKKTDKTKLCGKKDNPP